MLKITECGLHYEIGYGDDNVRNVLLRYIEKQQAEIEWLRNVFRVNMLRLAPETSHSEIDRVLDGEPSH